jgi:hypothetical protein
MAVLNNKKTLLYFNQKVNNVHKSYRPVSSWVSGINTHPTGSTKSTDFTSFISFLRVPALIEIFCGV